MENIGYSILLIIVGLFLGALLILLMNKLRILNSGKEADKLIEKATKEAEKLKRDKLIELKEESYKLKQDTDLEIKEKKKEIQDLKALVETRENSLNKRDELLQEREKNLDLRDKDLLAKQKEIQEKDAKMESILKEQIELLKKLKCEITLSLDNDDAGKNAMIRVIPELLNEGLEVNVLDISKLEGKYKDFGDLQVANIKKEDVYKTKISAFIFLLENQYLQNKELNVDNIYTIYKKMQRDGLIKNTKDILRFKEYVTNKTNFKLKEVEDIIMPKEVKQESRVERYKGLFFYYYIMDHLKKYAINHQDRILQKYLEANSISQEVIEETLNNENYLKDGENTIDISRYVNEYIYTSDDYIKFKNDKIFILENLLNNVKSFDQEGKVVNIKLSVEQKDIVLKQYAESFETSIKEYIENNPDEFEDLFIANNTSQFEKLFPKTYVETLKEQAVSRFKNENVMEAVRYGLAYPDNMKSAMTRQFVNNDKYKTLLVFNNNKNILGLTPKNIIKETKEELERKPEKVQDDIQKTEVETAKNNKDMFIFIKLSGKEKESYKGIYLPIDSGTQVFIPKQLYRIDDGRLQILNSQSKSANMSEYAVDENTRTKKFMNRLTLDNFYHKYFNLYEISIDRKSVV